MLLKKQTAQGESERDREAVVVLPSRCPGMTPGFVSGAIARSRLGRPGQHQAAQAAAP